MAEDEGFEPSDHGLHTVATPVSMGRFRPLSQSSICGKTKPALQSGGLVFYYGTPEPHPEKFGDPKKLYKSFERALH